MFEGMFEEMFGEKFADAASKEKAMVSYDPYYKDEFIQKAFTLAKEFNSANIKIFKMRSGSYNIMSSKEEMYSSHDSEQEAKIQYIQMCMGEIF